MNVNLRFIWVPRILGAAVLAGLFLIPAGNLAAEQPATPEGAGQVASAASGAESVCEPGQLGSPFIPVDSWIYPEILRLYSMGYIDNIFLGIRPWTRALVSQMLDEAAPRISDAEGRGDPTAQQAQEIYNAINYELLPDVEGPCLALKGKARITSVYSVARAISGTPLRDSFHLGSTIINDYGRPYENGFNNYSGISGYATAGRFAVYVRSEFQGAPSAAGYPTALAQTLSNDDGLSFLNPATNTPYNQPTIPLGPIATATQGRVVEAYASVQVLNHVISFGKVDDWLSPAEGASMAYSNNAEDIYAFHIDRIEPLYIPLLSRLTGPFRYEFLVGSLRGHTLMPNPACDAACQASSEPAVPNVINPGDPWVHVEQLSFKPTPNVEFGFERTVIFGGEGHSPVTLHTFLRSFFSFASPSGTTKFGFNDPGARFGSFQASYRLPFMRHWLTFYTDSEVHDDVSPIDAPRRAAWRPGLYLSHVPGIPRLDLRVEGAMTDPSVSTSQGGTFMYWETMERQGYTNQGQIFGDWIGREDKGGQAWITYHLSGDEWIQANWRRQKAAKDFIPDGTTLDDFGVQVVKRIGKDIAINGNFTYENWRAPVYKPGQQTVTTTDIQLTWYPQRKISF